MSYKLMILPYRSNDEDKELWERANNSHVNK